MGCASSATAWSLGGTPAFYQNNTLLLEEVELPCIWAELYNPLPSEEFRSTITIHLTVER